ncbi:MAG: hypothetical protein EXS39_04705 [Opitutaceae bacterium]|nr:hypothetical protein [Opitutaceae bacterium]
MKPSPASRRDRHRRRLPAAVFAALAGSCLRRFFRQNGLSPLPKTLPAEFLARVWAVVEEAGWPRPLAGPEQGEPAEMAADRVADLAARVFAGLAFPERHAELVVPTRQLLKACLQPEFRRCRESYHEVIDGACRRQELTRARGRMSGVHCVDCPYWVALRPGQHGALLTKAWVAGGPERFAAQREIFLPKDYRALRKFLWQHVRSG